MISLLTNVTALLAVAAVGLAGYIVHQIVDEQPAATDDIAAPVETTAADVTAATEMTAEFPSEDLMARIAARPLFSASRRPDPPAPSQKPVADSPVDDKPALELIGTMVTGGAHVALLQHPTDGLLRLRPGQRVDGWTIVDVENRRVRLEHDDGLDVLTLRKDQIRPAAPPAPRKNGRARKPDDEGEYEDEEPAEAPEAEADEPRRRI